MSSKMHVWVTSAVLAAQVVGRNWRNYEGENGYVCAEHMGHTYSTAAMAGYKSQGPPASIISGVRSFFKKKLKLKTTFEEAAAVFAQMEKDEEVQKISCPDGVPRLMFYSNETKKLLVATALQLKNMTLIGDTDGQWFQTECKEVYPGMLFPVDHVWYKAYDVHGLEKLACLNLAKGLTLENVICNYILPAIQRGVESCTPEAARNLAIRAGLVVARKQLRKSGNIGYTAMTMEGIVFDLPWEQASTNVDGNAMEDGCFHLLAIPELRSQSVLKFGKLNLETDSTQDVEATSTLKSRELEICLKGAKKPSATVHLKTDTAPPVLPHDPTRLTTFSGDEQLSDFFVRDGKLWEPVRIRFKGAQDNRAGGGEQEVVIKDPRGWWWNEKTKQRLLIMSWKQVSEVDATPVQTLRMFDAPHVDAGDWRNLLPAAFEKYYKTSFKFMMLNCKPRKGPAAMDHVSHCGWFSGLKLLNKRTQQTIVLAIGPHNTDLSSPPIVFKSGEEGLELLQPQRMSPKDYVVQGVCLVHAGRATPAMTDIQMILDQCCIKSLREPKWALVENACNAVNKSLLPKRNSVTLSADGGSSATTSRPGATTAEAKGVENITVLETLPCSRRSASQERRMNQTPAPTPPSRRNSRADGKPENEQQAESSNQEQTSALLASARRNSKDDGNPEEEGLKQTESPTTE